MAALFCHFFCLTFNLMAYCTPAAGIPVPLIQWVSSTNVASLFTFTSYLFPTRTYEASPQHIGILGNVQQLRRELWRLLLQRLITIHINFGLRCRSSTWECANTRIHAPQFSVKPLLCHHSGSSTESGARYTTVCASYWTYACVIWWTIHWPR